MWMNEKVLVTGSGGFIGSHLVEELVHRGAHVRAMVHYNGRNDWGNLELLPQEILKSVEVVAGDIQDAYFVRRNVRGCSVVFHLAALIGIPYSYVAPSSYVSTNVMGTLNMMQACLDEGVTRVVHTSTSETYGTAIYVPIDEQHPLQGQSPYSASKIGADKIAESYYLSFNLPVSTIRPFNTFGPRQSARAVIPTIILQALTKPEIKLGSLAPIRDLTYVKDTVEGFLLAAKFSDSIGQTINIGNGKGVTVGDLVTIVCDLLQMKKDVLLDDQRVRPKNSEVLQLICDRTRAENILKWEPKISLRDGLKNTIGYLQQNLVRYKSDIYNI
jgi:NAD dependent epimerase/dehydratase